MCIFVFLHHAFYSCASWAICLCCAKISESSLHSVSLVSPRFSDAFLLFLPSVRAAFRMVLCSLDMIILVTPIWKTSVCTLAHTYLHSLAWVETRRRRMHNVGHTHRQACGHACIMHIHTLRNHVFSFVSVARLTHPHLLFTFITLFWIRDNYLLITSTR